MARRRKKGGLGGLLYFIGPILAFVAPVVLVGCWIFAEARWIQLAGAAKAAGITPDPTFARWRVCLQQEVFEIEQCAAVLEASGDEESVPRRSDGLFDGRSSIGKRLNFELAELDDQLATNSYWSGRIRRTVPGRSAMRAGMLMWVLLTGIGQIAAHPFAQASASASLFAIPGVLATYLMVRFFGMEELAQASSV